MISDNNTDPNNKDTANNEDTLGDNPSENGLNKGTDANVQDAPDDTRVETVTPDNENGDPGPSDQEPATNKQANSDSPTSNKGQGPSGENL